MIYGATYEVRTRYGWGFEVVGKNYQSYPFESAIDAQTFADHLNAGDTTDQALKRMQQIVDFRGGRFYAA